MAFPDDLTQFGRDAIVLRGYLVEQPIPRILNETAREGQQPGPRLFATKGQNPGNLNPDPDIPALVAAALAADNRLRLYLSPRFDRYVDFAEADKITETSPTPDDNSVIVWLKPNREYWITTETRLDPSAGFLRGELLQDYLGQSDWNVAWDEQSPTGGRKRRSGATCYK